jgi:hypothetical protein
LQTAEQAARQPTSGLPRHAAPCAFMCGSCGRSFLPCSCFAACLLLPTPCCLVPCIATSLHPRMT